MKKYALAMVLALITHHALAVDMPSITSNTTRDGSANPVENSTSMGNEGGTPINGNSPVVIDTTGRQNPGDSDVTPDPVSAQGTTVVQSRHHPSDAGTTPANPPGDE